MDSIDDVNSQYSRTESEDGSEAEKTPMIGHSRKYSKTSRTQCTARSVWVLATLVVSLTANAILLSLWLWLPRDLDAICLKHTSAVWSPIMDDVKLRYKPVVFDGNPFKTSVYMQDSSPQVDKAWADLGINLKFTAIVPEERGLEAGLDPSAIKINATQGGGYVTTVRVLHQLHCLNMIRQTLPWNVDYYSSRRAGVYEKVDSIVRLHIDHCVDMIRQQLQCSSDVGMLGLRWVQEEGKRIEFFPSFSTTHMCKNFDDVVEWAETHQRSDELIPVVREGDVLLPGYE